MDQIKEALKLRHLSAQAVGIYCYMVMNPDNLERIEVADILSRFRGLTRNGAGVALSELRRYRLLEIKPIHGPDNKMLGSYYQVSKYL